MEYLVILIAVFGIAGLLFNGDELDASEQRDKIRKSIQKDAQWQIGHNWIHEGNRK